MKIWLPLLVVLKNAEHAFSTIYFVLFHCRLTNSTDQLKLDVMMTLLHFLAHKACSLFSCHWLICFPPFSFIPFAN